MVQTVWKPISDDPALFYVISAAWGVCNAIWEMLNFSKIIFRNDHLCFGVSIATIALIFRRLKMGKGATLKNRGGLIFGRSPTNRARLEGARFAVHYSSERFLGAALICAVAALLTGLYPDNWEAPFANAAFFRFLGFSAAFAVHGLVCNFVKLYALAFFMLFAAAPLTYLEIKLENIRKVKNISRL